MLWKMNFQKLPLLAALGVVFASRAFAQNGAPPSGNSAAPPLSIPPAEATSGAAPSSLVAPLPPQVPGESLAPVPAPEAPPKPKPHTSIEIDLQMQKAYLLRDGKKIAESPVSSGRAGHLTPRGDFEVVQKDIDHRSTLYGKIVDRKSGRVVVSGADAAMPVPRGCKFEQAPMKYFLRFEGAAGMHAGILPGYPASHGCVRMPAEKAKLFYTQAEIGSPVHVFGNTPTRAVERPAFSHRIAARTDRNQEARHEVARADTTVRVERAEEIPPSVPSQEETRRGWFPFFRH